MKKNFFRFPGQQRTRRDMRLSLFDGKNKIPFDVPHPASGIQPDITPQDESSDVPAHESDHVDEARILGIALVGLGEYSKENLVPALMETKYCRLAGLVGGACDKLNHWKQKYHIPDKNTYTYKNFDNLADNPDIDVVYIVLPNALHAEFTIRAAQAGKHVICEKPMATSLADCQAMIDACKKADRKLGIGYRLHYEPYNLEMMRLGQKEIFGPVQKIITANGQQLEDGDWRLDKSLSGGGALMDMGIYCLQGAIYTKGQLPVSVTASYTPITDKKKFKGIEEGMRWQMEFEDGTIAECETSYSTAFNRLRAETEQGWFELEPAYAYGGIQGTTSKGKLELPGVNQQALMMDDFAQCVLNDREPKVSGEMGMRDVNLLYTLYQAASSGNTINIQGW